jgi:hypothetical protein
LYNTYYEELENYAKLKKKGRHPHGYYRTSCVSLPALHPEPDEDCEEFEEQSEDDIQQSDTRIEEFGTNLIVNDGMLTITDDFLQNDGQKVLDLMEYLAHKKIRATLEDNIKPQQEEWDDYEDVSNSDNSSEDENHLTDQQRMEEGRRMFQIFTAKMIEQNILTAYRDKVFVINKAAFDRAQQLVQELEEEEEQNRLKIEQKQKKAEKEKERQKYFIANKNDEREGRARKTGC